MRKGLWIGFTSTLLAIASQTALAEQTDRGAAGVIGAWRNVVGELADHLAALGQALYRIPDAADRALLLLTDQRGLPALAVAMQVLVGLVVFGLALEWLIARQAAPFRGRVRALVTDSWLRRAGYLSILLGIEFLSLFVFVVATNVGSFAFYERFDPLRELVTAAILTIATARLTNILSRFLLAPDAPQLRLVALDDRAARRGHRLIATLGSLASVGYFGGGLFSLLGIPDDLIAAWHLVLGLAFIGFAIALVWIQRLVFAPAAQGAADGAIDPGDRPIAQIWGVAATIYLVLAWCVWAGNLLLGRSIEAVGVFGGVVIIVLAPLVDAILEGILLRHRGGAAESGKLRQALLGTLRAILITLALVALVDASGVPIIAGLRTTTGAAILDAGFDIVVALLLGYLGWEGSKWLMERHLGPVPPPGIEPAPGTRTHTLLPILRSFVLIVLTVIIGLIVLSSLGINIGPLLTGAGIVGIAIGFGAQTLVRDIVSGFFFLLDDAFRIGEYVDGGRVKGTVERITIRSLQLRHHRGALHTVPYGQIQALTNHSRDWVIEKLEFGLVYGTDSEKVRKIIKKIGKEMMEDPAIAPFILETLKSQGIKQLGDFSMVFRTKFKARPGQQFLVRREAYRRMLEAFAASGIEIAFPTVTVGGSAPSEAAAAALVSARTGDQTFRSR
ncbi:MAG: mechanosensitive ion channel family protein [Pseudomonadota bacterium]